MITIMSSQKLGVPLFMKHSAVYDKEFNMKADKNSLNLTSCSPEADYVNTDIINELIKEQDISNGSSNSRHHQHHPNAAILERPKSVAEISQKENGCVIKIKGDEVRYNFSKMHIIVVPDYQVPFMY